MHTMTAVAESGDEMMFRCLSCPREIVVGKRRPKTVVLTEGDQVSHLGGIGAVEMGSVEMDA